VAGCGWLTDAELSVYAGEYARTGFQGGLQWYRCALNGMSASDLVLFAGRTIDTPSLFIAGKSDWGVYQAPGAFEAMQARALSDMRGCHLVDGAGHWVQQEQSAATSALLLEFLAAAEK
jgi:pimeloyl-ACP methyl ester carboxylesterase